MAKKVIPIVLLCIGIFTAAVYMRGGEKDLKTFDIHLQTEQEMKDELIIAVFIQDIRARVEAYYVQKEDRTVTVYNYETMLLDVQKKEGRLIELQFGITPQVGAHNRAGYDVLTYTIDSDGNEQFVDYKHIKTYEFRRRE